MQNGRSQKDRKLVYKTDYRLMQVKSILQYFRPSLGFHLSLRSFLSIFEWPFYTGFTVTEHESFVQLLSFKRFLTWSSGDPPVQWSRTIYAISKEGIMGNINVKVVQEEMSFKEKV